MLKIKKQILIQLIYLVPIGLYGQDDVTIGTSYQFNLQRKNPHADAFILHNAEYSQSNDKLKWENTHPSFGSRGIRFGYSSDRGIYFYADDVASTAGVEFTPTTRFFIGNNGNVGVGTTTPQSSFQVNDIRPILFSNNGGSGVYGSEIGFNAKLNTSITPNEFVKLGNTEQYGGAVQIVDYRGNMHFQMYNAESKSESTTNYTPQVTFTNSGNVGIGTTIPDAKLAVKGQIHSQEVKVDLLGAVAPDFVFEETYDLRTLEETEQYIRSNKHLPEIPSAKEMIENGIELKEMNLKLLQKVEELTLHLIDQNKRIEKLENEIKQLKKE